MKKLNFIIPVACLSLTLGGCLNGNFVDSDNGKITLDHLIIENVKTDFEVGQTYQDALSYDVKAVYSDESIKPLTSGYKFAITKFVSIDNLSCSADAPIEVAGEYLSTFMVSYTDNGNTRSEGFSATNNFASIFEKGSKNCIDFSAKIKNILKPNDLIKDNLDIELDFVWEGDIHEKYNLTSAREDIPMTLKVDGIGADVIDSPLVRNTSYVLEVQYKEFSAQIPFKPALGFQKIYKEDLTILPTDFNKAYSPNTSKKTMVVPVSLSSNVPEYQAHLMTWDNAKRTALSNAYNDSNPMSFKSYYSHLGLDMDIFVTDVVTEADLKVEHIVTQNKPWTALYALIKRTMDKINEMYDSTFLKDFDSNSDGQIDNFHLIPNYDETSWGTPFWPHQGQTFNNQGTVDVPAVNTYCVGSFSKATTIGEVTQVHEQGHVFGLLDYYDYSNNGASLVNYVGRADMQSDNVFDWNSYSKLSCGFLSTYAYVVTGYEDSIQLELGASVDPGVDALGEDRPQCIIVPANYDTWNGSAYDEYFLIELFSKKGVNENDWDTYTDLNTIESGVRIYHVDARLYDQFKAEEASEDKTKWSAMTIIGANNCSDYTALGIGSPEEWGDFKQLALIQKGGIDTFGQNANNGHHELRVEDLFLAGDTFTFANYKHFLSKSNKPVTTMDNGEEFPWTITIDSLNKDSATITISK